MKNQNYFHHIIFKFKNKRKLLPKFERLIFTFLIFVTIHSYGICQSVVIGTETCTLPNGTTVTLTYFSRDEVFLQECHEDIFIEVEICGDPGQETSVEIILDAEYYYPAFLDPITDMNGDFKVSEIFEGQILESYALTLNPIFDNQNPCKIYTSTIRTGNVPLNSFEKPDQSFFNTYFNGAEECTLDTPEIQFQNSVWFPYDSVLDNIQNNIIEESDLLCSNNNEKRYTIPLNLEIDTDVCFKNALLSMTGESAGITVKSGYTLTIEDSELTYCSEFWLGITVEPDAILTIKNSTIEGAINTITVQNHGKINLNQVKILDFQSTGISFSDPNFTFSTSYVSEFEGVTFKGTGLMPNIRNPFGTGPGLLPYDLLPNVGVSIINFLYIQLIGDFDPVSQVLGASKLNKYENLQNGIISRNCSDLRVGFSQFESIEKIGINVKVSGYNFFNFAYDGLENEPSIGTFNIDDFNNVNVGIEVTNSDVSILDASFQEIQNTAIHLYRNPNHHQDIRNNTINSHGIGIHGNLSFPSTAIIENNDLSSLSGNQANILCNSGIFNEFDDQEGSSWEISNNTINNTDAGFYGIAINGGNNFDVHSNIIDFAGRGQGIGVLFSPDVSVYDNKISGGDQFTAISATLSISGDYRENELDGGNKGAVFRFDNGRCDFRCNDISNFETGVALTSNSIIGPQYSKYNCWANNTDKDLSHADMNVEIVELSKFTVLFQGDQNNNCYVPPYSNAFSGTGNVEDFYFQKEGVSEPNCQEGRPLPPLSEDYIQDVIQTELYDLSDGDALNWMSQFIQYPYISQNDFSNTPIVNHVNTYLNTTNSVSFFQDIWSQIKIWKSDGFNISDHASNDLELLENLNELIQNESNESNLAILINQRNQLSNQIQADLNNLELNFNIWTSDNQSTLSNIIQRLDDFQTNESFEINLKQSTLAYLQLIENGHDFLDADYWNSLYAIAIQCPADGGPGVFLARTIYNTLQLTDFIDYNECTETQFRTSNDQEKALIVYPNPNNGEFTIEIKEDGEFSLLNQFGQLINKYQLKEGSQSINLSSQLPGIYYLTNGSTINAKIVYIK